MAHAWKACWVHALAGSNPASSASWTSTNAGQPRQGLARRLRSGSVEEGLIVTDHEAVRAFYAEPGAMTSPGEHAALVDALPADLNQLVSIIHGLGIYDVVASDFYGVDLPDDRQAKIHTRRYAEMIDELTGDGHGPAEARPPDQRLACRCRNFTLLLLGPLRAKGIPARARYGFAAYFNPGHYEDHVVCEFWNASEERWQLVDAQLDEMWCERLGIGFDVLDVPRDQFLVAADAWRRCRQDGADPDRFGISFADLHGLWFVAGNLVRDLAALNKTEMLSWDVWGAQSGPDQRLDAGQLAFFDQLALLTREPDASFDQLRQTYRDDDRVRVPHQVHNALLDRSEPL